MTSKSFCLDDLNLEAQQPPATTDKHPMSPQVYKSFQNKQERDFLQLYIKARSQRSDKKSKKSSSSQQHSFDSAQKDVNDENKYDFNSEPHSPNIPGNSLRPKTVLKELNIDHSSKGFALSKPSRFKLNHEAGLNSKTEQKAIELDQPCNEESLHDIESKEVVEIHQGPTSMEVLLPSQKEDHHNRGSCDLEIQINTGREEIKEDEEEHKEDQDHEDGNNNDHHRVLEIGNNLPNITTASITSNATANRAVFGPHVNRAYKQTFKLYAVWLLSYGILLGANEGVFPYYVAFLFAFAVEACLLFSFCQDVILEDNDLYHSRRKLNYSFYIISLAIIQALGLLKFAGINFAMTWSVVPIAMATLSTCYLNTCRNPRRSNSLVTVIQTLISLQIFCICLKVDGLLEWTWQGTFFMTWASLVVIVFYCIGLFMVCLFYLFFEESSITQSYQLAGLGWILTGFSGFAAASFFVLYGYTNKLATGTDENWIHYGLLGGLCHVGFLSAVTLFGRNKIKQFLQVIVRPDPQVEQGYKAPEVRLEKATEGLPAYIVKFTPSYFLTFDQSIKVKDENKLRSMKKKVSLTKSGQYRRAEQSKNPERKRPENILTYKDKITPDGNNEVPNKINGIAGDKVSSPYLDRIKQIFSVKNIFSEASSPALGRSKPKVFASEAKRQSGKVYEELNDLEVENDKMCFSANDLEFVKKAEAFDFLSDIKTPLQAAKKAVSEKDDDKGCIICYDNYPDAVIMGCGHGGVCYECALESYKKSQECFLCRGKIEKVLHIDKKKTGRLNIQKVLSATKLVKERPNNEDNFISNFYVTQNPL